MLLKTVTAATKYLPTAAGVAVADITIGGFDLVQSGAILVGLAAGAVLRSSRHVEENAGWAVVRKDLLLSIMAGLSNFIIASITVAMGDFVVPNFPVLASAGVGLFFGHQGPDAIKWFNKRFFGQSDPREPRYAQPPKPAPPSMEDLAKRLDKEQEE